MRKLTMLLAISAVALSMSTVSRAGKTASPRTHDPSTVTEAKFIAMDNAIFMVSVVANYEKTLQITHETAVNVSRVTPVVTQSAVAVLRPCAVITYNVAGNIARSNTSLSSTKTDIERPHIYCWRKPSTDPLTRAQRNHKFHDVHRRIWQA